ncbi:hypothetical protein [Marinobacterium sediminicola]|uniref:Uncharacterized protein n=1 Tax=Marinobacterium sediminicola TaxID=518898 RepID=A0ABY1S3X3_9GAMM|nr:hypothetical protein [Marinobacterium sediminicola]ULG70193.1 hypothetical protein LN244_05105 [Marinobacterium sediminicola]SMR78336.1 hypothetical protein SAMN04487964_1212 [Marinobacterium sediminicola]
MKRYWRIRGMNGLDQVSELMIPSGSITDKNLELMLQALVAKHGLSDDEIVSCFYRKNCKAHRNLLEVRHDRKTGHLNAAKILTLPQP